jgi:hypothetical protein
VTPASSALVLARVPRRVARAIGAALMAYGAAGALLISVLALSVAPAMATLDAVAGSSVDVHRALTTTRDAFEGFGVSLVEARRATTRAATSARTTASTSRQLADAMGISIFGARPLLPIAQGFEQQRKDLEALAVELDALAETLQTDEKDVRTLRDQVVVLRDRAALLGAAAGSGPPLAPILYALLGWFGLQAVAAFWAGTALWRAEPQIRA